MIKITDKILHFSISFLIASTIFLYCYLFNLSILWCFLLSNVGAIGIGIVKEIIDSRFDWKDIVADVIGVIVSDIVIEIIFEIR
ncbi:MAG TPA: hypothetical protein PLN36_09415 [Bacteroidales bacterium]|nr:hypothetical protein [Bacteroidales bacterium]